MPTTYRSLTDWYSLQDTRPCSRQPDTPRLASWGQRPLTLGQSQFLCLKMKPSPSAEASTGSWREQRSIGDQMAAEGRALLVRGKRSCACAHVVRSQTTLVLLRAGLRTGAEVTYFSQESLTVSLGLKSCVTRVHRNCPCTPSPQCISGPQQGLCQVLDSGEGKSVSFVCGVEGGG